MERDEDSVVVSVGDGCPIVKGRVLVAVAREDDMESQALQFGSHDARESENHIFLGDAVCSTRAQVRPAMRGVEHNDAEPVCRRLGFLLCRCRRRHSGWRTERRRLRRLLRWRGGRLWIWLLRSACRQSRRQGKNYKRERDSHGKKA